MTAADWARLEAMTDAEVLAAARSDPDQAARAYLEVIARNPKAVIAALHPRQ
jgi:DNA-binding transcriptional regulator YiaG